MAQIIQNKVPEDGETVQKLRILATLSEDWSPVTRTHMRWLMTNYNSGSRGSYTLFWPPEAHRQMDMHEHI